MKGLSVLAAVVVLLMVHALGGSATRVSPLAACDPDCTGVADEGVVADPVNCTNYYVCRGGIPYGPLSCSYGNVFNPETGACEPGTTCELCGDGGVHCPLTCNGTVVAIGDAFDCNIYYYCTPSLLVPQYCDTPGYPYYDGNTFSCSADPSVCCSGYCTPYCNSGSYEYILVPDPNSCTEFYVCLEEGEVDENNHFSCNSGQVFNIQGGMCVRDTGEPCVTLCDAAAGGGDGSSSITTPEGGGDTTPAIITTGSCSSTDSNGFVSSLDCTAAGNFAACSTCQPEYFSCSGAGASGVLKRCPNGYVFNSLPENPICVGESYCPYP